MPDALPPPEAVDRILRAELTQTLREAGKVLPLLSDDLRLDADLGLTSLEVTALLVRLTSRLDAGGAQEVMAEADVATVGDLRRALTRPAGRGPAARDELAETRRRAQARRASGR